MWDNKCLDSDTPSIISSHVGWGTVLQAGKLRIQFPMRPLDFSTDLILPAAYVPGVDSASNRNEYQVPGGKGRPVLKANNLIAICQPIV
jgi:hypothetical protein